MTTGESTTVTTTTTTTTATTTTATTTTTTSSVLCSSSSKSLQQKQTIEGDTKSSRLLLGAGGETGGSISSSRSRSSSRCSISEVVVGEVEREKGDWKEAPAKGGNSIPEVSTGTEANGTGGKQVVGFFSTGRRHCSCGHCGLASTNTNTHLAGQCALLLPECQEEGTEVGPLIDSRSILTNKNRLKRFWEARMEMEFKLRQQEKQQQLQLLHQHMDAAGAKDAHLSASWKQESSALDQNNNNNNDGETSHDECPEDLKASLMGADNGVKTVAYRSQGQQPAKESRPKEPQVGQIEVVDTSSSANNDSGSQWRSLSPNVEPTQSAFAAAASNRSQQAPATRQVSECEEASSYLLAAATAGGQQRAEGGCLDSAEQQLMSIDPLLSGTLRCVSLEDGGDNGTGVQKEQQQQQQQQTGGGESEEQTASEEFCSSSSSSFGLLSMSTTARLEKPPTVVGDQVSRELHLNHWDEDEEPTDSAQSGSVNTVIGMHQGADEHLSLRSEELLSMEPTLGVTTEEEEVEEEGGGEDSEPEEEPLDQQGDSNIGVAFESLHFDTEIKSSKSERVEERPVHQSASGNKPWTNGSSTNYLRQQPVEARRSLLSRFDVVKSVCNSIAAAIGDSPSHHSTANINSHETTDEVDETDGPSRAVNGEAQEESSVREVDGQLLRRAEFVASQEELLIDGVGQGRARTQPGKLQAEQLMQTFSEDGINESVAPPKADLSSMFEANVRREIERFETASGFKKPPGKGSSKNGLTEWRIAEEIRLFNERELELKRRLEGSEPSPGVRQQQQQQQQQVSSGIQNGPQAQQRRNNKQQPTDNIVRFGKNIQVPRSVDQQPQISTKSIKLSTTATSGSADGSHKTTISMHKFISSSGKRFVIQNSTNVQQQQNNSTVGLANSRHKSKSNGFLQSSQVSGAAAAEPPVAADYKAIDSLTTKETPNVEPGLTRKAIETFSRLSNGNSSNSSASSSFLSSCTLSPRHQHQATISQLSPPVVSSSASTTQPQSAEWKIQEELREMRTREAELRSQRSHLVAKSSPLSNGSSHAELANSSGEDEEQRFAGEPLCNLKKTIDTFRKIPNNQINSSNNNNHSVPSKAPVKNGLSIRAKQVAEQQASSLVNDQSMDYESKVAKQAQNNKHSSIEKWKKKLLL